MGRYETEAMGLASAQATSTMQNYMNENSGSHKSAFDQFRETYNERVLSDFCKRILNNVYSKYANQESEAYLKEYYENFIEDIVPIFERINEECLNDPAFSSQLIKGEEYSKRIGTDISLVAFSPVRKLEKEMLYVPSSSQDQPNIIRLIAKEQIGSDEYPCYMITTDICDDGTIKTTPPQRMESAEIGEPVNMEETKIEVKDDIFTTQEVLMDLFQKAGIKEQSSEDSKAFSN